MDNGKENGNYHNGFLGCKIRVEGRSLGVCVCLGLRVYRFRAWGSSLGIKVTQPCFFMASSASVQVQHRSVDFKTQTCCVSESGLSLYPQ